MIDGERRGPYELDQLADAGVRPSTYIWCKELDDWEKAEDNADICRMFRNRLYDLMHPESTAAEKRMEESASGVAVQNNAITPGFTRQIQEPGNPLTSLEEIEERENKISPSPLLLPLAILVTVFFFPPTGFPAIYNALKARKEWKANPGSAEAGRYCRNAKMWTGISFFLGIILMSALGFRF